MVNMDGAGSEQADDMERRIVLANMGGGFGERRIGEKIPVGNGFVDPGQVLEYHAAGAEGKVADFAVTSLAEGHADGLAGGLQQHRRIIPRDLVERRRAGRGDRVAHALFGIPPAVQNCEYHRSHRMFSISDIALSAYFLQSIYAVLHFIG